MPLRWKDFFYFRQSDKNAIILLCALIIVCGGGSLFFDKYFSAPDPTDKNEQVAESSKNKEKKIETETGSENQKDTENSKKNLTEKTEKKLSEGESIDINNASAEALKRIPGIGEGYAKRIVEYRDLLGGFASTEQITEVKGVTHKKYEKIRSFIHIKKAHKTIKINVAAYNNLASHPYISNDQAKAIVDYRKKNGNIKNLDELDEIEEFAPPDINRITPYISFSK